MKEIDSQPPNHSSLLSVFSILLGFGSHPEYIITSNSFLVRTIRNMMYSTYNSGTLGVRVLASLILQVGFLLLSKTKMIN